MKLRYSPTSPYVRKVTVVALETGLDGRIERIPTSTADPKSGLAEQNPLGKVPTLVTDDGTVLFDSPVICEYLDSLHDGRKLIPPSGPARWTVLRQQALADGVLDAAVLRVGESRRPKTEQSPAFLEKQKTVIARALDAFEREVDTLPAEPTLGTITLGVALGYLDFRWASDAWRTGRPKLARWYEAFAQRPSMLATVPKDPA
ncbi:MAG: glutathione S-transferase N-terminal domain-containing protein [Rhodospirillaceae bacterium]|nr:glutathione S-transferase N-terminal domain-containing protein [Rhodospirillaceae bacterium]